MLAEDTDEHRQILGDDGEAAIYFRSPAEMIERLEWLLAHEGERERLKASIHKRITSEPNTYKDRLDVMLSAGPTS